MMLLNKTKDDDAKKMVNASNNDNRTALHIAAITNNVKLCKFLVAKGAKNNNTMRHKVCGILVIFMVLFIQWNLDKPNTDKPNRFCDPRL